MLMTIIVPGRADPPRTAAPRGVSALVYSPWQKFCGREHDGAAICFTGKEGHTEAGHQAVTAAVIEPSGN